MLSDSDSEVRYLGFFLNIFPLCQLKIFKMSSVSDSSEAFYRLSV